MRIIYCLLVLSLFFWPNSLQTARQTTTLFSAEVDEKLHTQCLYPCVFIQTENGNASGTVVRSEKIGDEYRNVILTCAHVAKQNPTSISVPVYFNWSRVKSYDAFPCAVYKIYDKIDIAVLVCTTTYKLYAAEISFTDDFYIGTNLLKVGCGLGDDPRVDYGKITGFPQGVYYRISAPTIMGDSGGPTYYKNKLIGLSQSVGYFSYQENNLIFYDSAWVVPIGLFKVWSEEENNCLDFIYNRKKRMPVMPFFHIRFQRSPIILPEGNPE